MTTKNLHKAHARAHAVGQNALDVFRKLADDLRRSAQEHLTVSDEAHAQVLELATLRDSADAAASSALVQAQKIDALVGK